ncbi:hypothetical protein MJO29_005032 [Puccinia striiformis f. sp. tritici]|nr:hypothetical protein MJO29_005032 [Puccinia striiformis f. sp. tritici]
MCIMNILQRAYITLALLALFITLHPGQVEAGQITCSYHFNRVGAVEDRASCQYKDSVDYSCDPYSCATQENRGFESLYYRGCHGPQPIGDRQSIHAAQYFLRDDHAAVQDWDGLWWDCPYNIPDSTNKQYLTCTDCYYVPPPPPPKHHP